MDNGCPSNQEPNHASSMGDAMGGDVASSDDLCGIRDVASLFSLWYSMLIKPRQARLDPPNALHHIDGTQTMVLPSLAYAAPPHGRPANARLRRCLHVQARVPRSRLGTRGGALVGALTTRPSSHRRADRVGPLKWGTTYSMLW